MELLTHCKVLEVKTVIASDTHTLFPCPASLSNLDKRIIGVKMTLFVPPSLPTDGETETQRGGQDPGLWALDCQHMPLPRAPPALGTEGRS